MGLQDEAWAINARQVLLAAAAAITMFWTGDAPSTSSPLRTLPLQGDIWITGTIQQGSDRYAPDPPGSPGDLALQRQGGHRYSARRKRHPRSDTTASLPRPAGGRQGARDVSQLRHSVFTATGRCVSGVVRIVRCAEGAVGYSVYSVRLVSVGKPLVERNRMRCRPKVSHSCSNSMVSSHGLSRNAVKIGVRPSEFKHKKSRLALEISA